MIICGFQVCGWFFCSDSGSHFVLLCIFSNFCIWCWTLYMLHCWIFRFCFLPLMTIEVYFRRQLSYLQIGSILPRLVLLSVRAFIEQPLIYSNFRPMSKAWLPVKSIGIQWGLFTLVEWFLALCEPWESFSLQVSCSYSLPSLMNFNFVYTHGD